VLVVIEENEVGRASYVRYWPNWDFAVCPMAAPALLQDGERRHETVNDLARK
jgi:hypothetical protein